MSPMGTERRFSRSPRGTRSRSTDVDRLQKYAERIEERRNTEGDDITRIYANRWLNLPKSPNFYVSLNSPDSQDNLDIIESQEKLLLRKPSGSRDDPSTSTWREPIQSDSDIASSSNDPRVSPDAGTLSFRWVPLPRIGDRPQHSQKYLSTEFQGARYAASKWITFAKHPSPATSRSSLERKSSLLRFSSYYDRELRKNLKRQETVGSNLSTGDYDPTSSHTPHSKTTQNNETTRGTAITQRLGNFYKFRFGSNSSTSHHWMSSSEDEDVPSVPKGAANRGDSQELEFRERNPRGNPNPRFANLKSSIWKKFSEKLRFSEDLSMGRDKVVKYERKAFSEDYEESQRFQQQNWPNRLNSDRNEETESTDDARNGEHQKESKVKRRKDSGIPKHSSMEYKSSTKRIPIPTRSLSYGAEGRPPTPVPIVDDLVEESQPSKSSYLKQKRKSTRYKVYLT